MTRSEVLNTARKCVCEDRDKQYGSPENNFEKIAALWSDYRNEIFTGKDVAVMMILLKVARLVGGDSIDNYVDIAGYAACGGELSSVKETKNASKKTAIKHTEPFMLNYEYGKRFLANGRENIPKGRYCITTENGWLGLDNSTGDYWTEEFDSREKCLSWLNGDFEVSNKEKSK